MRRPARGRVVRVPRVQQRVKKGVEAPPPYIYTMQRVIGTLASDVAPGTVATLTGPNNVRFVVSLANLRKGTRVASWAGSVVLHPEAVGPLAVFTVAEDADNELVSIAIDPAGDAAFDDSVACFIREPAHGQRANCEVVPSGTTSVDGYRVTLVSVRTTANVGVGDELLVRLGPA